jgi:hypothetical protein
VAEFVVIEDVLIGGEEARGFGIKGIFRSGTRSTPPCGWRRRCGAGGDPDPVIDAFADWLFG